MSKVFRRKIFSNYLGEQRAIDDIISQFIPDPSSTPLPSLTPTPSITPTLTPNPLCPQQLIITQSNNSFYVDGTYNRLTTYSGGTFVSAYSDGTSERVKIGQAPNGKNYATYVFQSGTTFYQFIKRYDNERWGVVRTTGATWLDGGTYITQLFNAPLTDLFDGSLYYPTTGLQVGAISYYLSYPISCPTPTPTPTPSITPTLTPTITPTNSPTPSITPSITPTISPTPSITPSLTPTITTSPTPTPSPAPMYSFSGAVYDASSNSGACASSTVVSNLWGFNPVWTGNTGLFTDNIGTIPAPAGFYNYNGVVLEVIAGGGIPNPPYECPPVTPTPTPTMTPTPSPSAFDPDASLYLQAVSLAGGTLDPTISAATDTLFTELKSNNLYNKLNVFYPMLGATSGSTALMGKRVSGTTYDITWTNPQNITFDYSGATGDGSTAYGDTNFNGFNEISTAGGASSHMGIYVGTETNGNYSEIGTRTNGVWIIAVSFSNDYYGWHYSQGGGTELLYNNPDARGMYIQSRTSNTSLKTFKNNVEQQQRTYTESNTIPNSNVRIMSDTSLYSNRRFQFVSIGDGLNDTEAQTLSTIINTFQTSLGRNTY